MQHASSQILGLCSTRNYHARVNKIELKTSECLHLGDPVERRLEMVRFERSYGDGPLVELRIGMVEQEVT